MRDKLSNKETSALIDGILRVVVLGGVITTALAAPNAVQILDKPITKILNKLDERSRQRELQKTLTYMRRKQLISNSNALNYKHGIKITEKGLKRLSVVSYKNLQITKLDNWDKKWRIILFDIPENQKSLRNSFTLKMKSLGLTQLQKSVWIHPFPCKNEIIHVSERHGLTKYITYIETSHIDNQELLIKRFSSLLP